MNREIVHQILELGVKHGASDIHLKAEEPPGYRIKGAIVAANSPPLTREHLEHICAVLLPDDVHARISTLTDYDGSYEIKGVARFRLNVYRQKGTLACVMRIIKSAIPPLEKTGLPPSARSIVAYERGLVLVTGATGSGKTTSLAALINEINLTRKAHILTIEDPVEVVYPKGLATVSQREVGQDSQSFAAALKSALRQDPDVILIGEMRDQETIDIALKAAETGHLVFATVHTTDAMRTIGRLLSVFPAEAQPQIRIRMADALKATISQRLLESADGKGRVLAAEVMFVTAIISDCIRDASKTGQIKNFIEEGASTYGMQTFDQHLSRLLVEGRITQEVALDAATSPSDFLRNLNMAGGGGVSSGGLEIQKEE
jgi:twitching motility protein PilT